MTFLLLKAESRTRRTFAPETTPDKTDLSERTSSANVASIE